MAPYKSVKRPRPITDTMLAHPAKWAMGPLVLPTFGFMDFILKTSIVWAFF